MKMLSLLKDPFTKCYLEFLVYALEKFNKFNATFQNNQLLLHELQDYVNHLILDLSRSFMDGAYVDSFKSSPLKIDPKKDERFLPLRSIHVNKCKMSIVHSFFSLSKIEYLQILIGLKASQAITDCQQPRAISDPAEKQYFTLYFPKEKEEAEKKAKKFALDYVKSNLITVPDKNSLQLIPFVKITIPFFNPLSTKNLNGRSTQSIIFFFQCGTFTQKPFMSSKLVSILKMMYIKSSQF